MPENIVDNKINHLQLAEATARWQEKSLKDLYELKTTIEKKMDAIKHGSQTVYESLKDTHYHLEHYIRIRESQAEIAKQYKENGIGD
jgi:hypothetical protein